MIYVLGEKTLQSTSSGSDLDYHRSDDFEQNVLN